MSCKLPRHLTNNLASGAFSTKRFTAVINTAEFHGISPKYNICHQS
jgi:hypothetical protein